MDILWITKVHSAKYTGGTKVSYNYLEELGKTNNVRVHSLKNDTSEPDQSLYSFYRTLFKIKKNKYDLVFFDDHFSFISIFFLGHQTISFYHGNWPKLMFTSPIYFLKGLYLFPLYLLGMLSTKLTIFVNPYYEKLLGRFCRNKLTLLNPISKIYKRKSLNNQDLAGIKKIVLVGNLDNRKYSNLIKFLDWLEINKYGERFSFDVFGATADKSIEDELRSRQVNLKGFAKEIDYSTYDYHMSCSKAENLPLSLFEALISGVPSVYPKEKNYLDFENESGVLLYSTFDEALSYLNMDITEFPTGSFVPRNYQENIKKILSKLKDEI
ncbi:hypothetical protein [Pedobacter miscanthi]|uniref:Glycosyl transferase family 1 domain-containing protein n=1 Tax=Pedobacter miscanthi TaxID=2259170 RepID=A0A366KR03_9SPHI|nr:hypothetical protein [Pedobacter miscanthi]RBQ03564.1 hypothetical protein DRW42_21395 [Pedobacter miscanthi]